MIEWAAKKIAFNDNDPEDIRLLSNDSADLIKKCFKGINHKEIIDYHCHVLGMGKGGTGCFCKDTFGINENLTKLKINIVSQASGVKNKECADQEYIEKLIKCIKGFKAYGKCAILAFDSYYNEDGTINKEMTTFSTPNEYIYDLHQKYPMYFLPTISIHPYRKDAIEQLEHWGKKGVKMIKWLPNSMGIDPQHKLCIPYYEKVKELGMVILVHTGEEKAVVSHDDLQKFGNPLVLRTPLDMGVKIIMAHCATLGQNKDIDLDDESEQHFVDNFYLFLRMMDEPKYEGLLFGDISAICQINRMKYVIKLLERKDIHHRLLNGSDYPLVSVPMLVLTKPFENAGMLTEDQRNCLNEIYEINPLLFDFLLKRCLVGPNGEKFSESIFMRNKTLGLFDDEDLFKGEPLDIEVVMDSQLLPPCVTWAEKQAHYYARRVIKFYNGKFEEKKMYKIAVSGRYTLMFVERGWWDQKTYKLYLTDVVTGWDIEFEHPNVYYLLVRNLIGYFEHFGGENEKVERIYFYNNNPQLILENEKKFKKKLEEKKVKEMSPSKKNSSGVMGTIKSYTTDILWSGIQKISGKKDEEDNNLINDEETSRDIIRVDDLEFIEIKEIDIEEEDRKNISSEDKIENNK
eukprot:TRINITY_DN10592_c0_g1_i1.p1 TRINITY_DN10592_c0_g1~~TRINITY_DN10592_c0_g1_i1.p1  ORF type:complete len:629 (-),score=151.14 TRINITY_DN10592_c0_g1_i1:4-1890(-)